MTTKECSACLQTKPQEDFHKAARGLLGRRSHCIQCERVEDKKFYAKNRERLLAKAQETYKANSDKFRAKSAAWRVANLEKVAAAKTKRYRENPKEREYQRDYKLRKTYGITAADYASMDKEQGGCCAICGGKSKRALSVDHNHSTSLVRGLLCDPCNLGIGYFKERPDFLERAAAYLLAHLASEAA
jgi:hypothetical protein